MPDAKRRSPAVFLDRDGTIIEDTGYLADPAEVRLIPGAADALRRLAGAGYQLVVVSNQSGIARGLYGEDEYRAVQSRVESLLASLGARIEAAYYCPHHPDVTGPCACRKPGLALYQRAAAELGLDLRSSAFIGDKASDVLPAQAFGGAGYLVLTGEGARHVDAVPGSVRVVPDLARAADELVAGPEP